MNTHLDLFKFRIDIIFNPIADGMSLFYRDAPIKVKMKINIPVIAGFTCPEIMKTHCIGAMVLNDLNDFINIFLWECAIEQRGIGFDKQ